MCGRYTLAAEMELLQARFQFVDAPVSDYVPSYNIAPSQEVLAVIRDEEVTRAGLLRWGLVPSWAKDPKVGYRMINARAESVAEKPSFRRALRQRRCLILADGYYEWQRRDGQKIPMYMRLRNREPFAFAGLWERWHGADDTTLVTCTILTTQANAWVKPVHHRMPVILDPSQEALWLDRRVAEPDVLQPLFEPVNSDILEIYAVSPQVNSARYNSPACILPAATGEES
jgi:putative SOS response-associated peptidase YedK